MAGNYFVYIVECTDGKYYTGVTNNVERRVWEHNQGVNKKNYTYSRRPVILKFYYRFVNIDKAIEFEKQIKGWSRKKKEALFKEDWDKIKELAKRRQSSLPELSLRQAGRASD